MKDNSKTKAPPIKVANDFDGIVECATVRSVLGTAVLAVEWDKTGGMEKTLSLFDSDSKRLVAFTVEKMLDEKPVLAVDWAEDIGEYDKKIFTKYVSGVNITIWELNEDSNTGLMTATTVIMSDEKGCEILLIAGLHKDKNNGRTGLNLFWRNPYLGSLQNLKTADAIERILRKDKANSK